MIDIYSYDNEIPCIKDNVKNYINIILKNKKNHQICTRMTINFFYQSYEQTITPWIKISICGYNSEDVCKNSKD
jgi:hypothetical protein